MTRTFQILCLPLAAFAQLGLELFLWFFPNNAWRRQVFPESVKKLIEQADAVEVHYAELVLSSEGGPEAERGWRSRGMVKIAKRHHRKLVIRSIIQANKQCVVGFKCLDAEYGICFESDHGRVALMICFWCSQVWVTSKVEGAGRYYTIGCKPQELLDELLQGAGVSKPPDFHERHHV